jgi:hypothetical protein
MATLKEARKLFKEYAPSKYKGSKKEALRVLIESTDQGKSDADVTGRKFTVKVASLCRAFA